MQDLGKTKQTHLLSLGFGVALLVLVVVLFCTFAIGAYLVFNAPTSNVVAVTYDANTPAPYLVVNATSLNSSSSAIVWIDPNVNYDSNGYPSSVDQASGFRIANATTDQSGNLNQVFSVPQSTLKQIADDGLQVHSLWVILPNQSSTGTSGKLEISPFSEQNFSTSTQRSGITLFVTLFTFPLNVTFDLGSLFIILWTAYVVLFAMALNGPVMNLVRAIRTASRVGLTGVFENSVLATAAAFPLVLWSSVMLALLQQSVGVQTGSLPSTDPLLLFVELSIAPIREEIGFRVIPIGLCALAILLARHRLRDGLLSLWHPAKYLKKNSTPAEYSSRLKIMYFAGGLSAFLFGIAHYLLGAGWGPGKITEAAIAGIALAWLYYKYGLPAAILLHWSIDYALTAYQLTPALLVPYEIIIFYTLGVAVAALAALVLLFYRKMQSRKTPVPFISS